MKKISNLLFLLVAVLFVAQAQQQDQRTTNTRIADLLAQLPAENKEKFAEVMGEMERFSETDFSVLLNRLSAPGKRSNSGIEYATNSYSYHVVLPGKEPQRATFLKGALSVLSEVENKDNKAYIIQLLQNAGDDSAVPVLSSYLQGELSGEAARALARIGTVSSGKALLDRLASAQEGDAVQIINALGDMAYQPAEQVLLQRVASAGPQECKVLWYALANIGGVKSEPVLRKAAQQAKFVFEPTNASDAYLRYGNALYRKGNRALATKVANTVFKASSGADQMHTRVGALDLLSQIQGPRLTKTLLKGAKDQNDLYRHASLRLLSPYFNVATVGTLTRQLNREPAKVQADILNYLTAHDQQSVLPVAQGLLSSNSPEVRQSAMRALSRFGGDAGLSSIIGSLAEQDEPTQAVVKDLLLASKSSNLSSLLIAALATEKDPKATVILLDVLGNRGSAEAFAPILGVVENQSRPADVREAAYKALAQTSSPQDLDRLLELLLKGEQSSNKYVQEAIISSINRSDNKSAQLTKTIARFNQSADQQKASFFPIFAGVGEGQALSVVSDYLHHGNASLQDGARSSLALWRYDEALPVLVIQSRQAKDSAEKSKLINGFVRLVRESSIPDDQRVLWIRDVFEVAESVKEKRDLVKALETVRTYQAMMFAGRFLEDKDLKSVAANTVMNIALESPEFYGTDVTRLLNQVIGALSGSQSGYLREAVRKHLAELPKSNGYASLFNGKDLTGWKGLVENPIKRAKLSATELAERQAKADEKMRASWYVEDGVLHFNGKGDNIATVKQYGDIEMLVDWKLSKEGKDGDAGIYLRGTPQVQIWDISRTKVGAQVGSGGLYNNKVHPSKPLLVADNPLGEWNTFRIRMVGDRVTVYLNGQLVTDSVVLENFWDRGLPIFPKEQIELQAHGTQVSYRDIYVKELPRKEVFVLGEQERKEGFQMLFDGTSLDAWTGNKESYVISEEGTLAIFPKKGSGGNLYTKEEFGDFIYRFEFRLTPGANNGVGIRAPLKGNAAYLGHEIQVLDDDADMYKKLAPYQYHGSVYGIIPAKRGFLNPVGEWNEQEIYIKGNKIRVTLNGTVIVDGDLAEASKNGTLDKKDHPGLKRASGHIAFLGHGSEVHFRNIRVKRL